VISCHGRQAWVETDDGSRHLCHLRGRELAPLTNDLVVLNRTHSPPTVESIGPRANTLLRQEGDKAKRLAANIDLAWVVVSGHPIFSPDILLRVLASLMSQRIPTWVLLNKTDQAEPTALARAQLQALMPQSMDCPWPVVETHIQSGGLNGLMAMMSNAFPGERLSVALMGQSGMGKSSLLNRLVPSAQAQTQAISEALQTGRHTTTSSQAYHWAGGRIIDTPGFQKFGIGHLEQDDLTGLFPEFQMILSQDGACRYANCSHRHEPGCPIREAASSRGLGARLEQWEGLLTALERERLTH